VFDHPVPKCRFVCDGTIMGIEIITSEFRQWTPRTPGAGKKVLVSLTGQQGEEEIADTRDREVLGASAKLDT